VARTSLLEGIEQTYPWISEQANGKPEERTGKRIGD
jgi:hypothetical protein